MLVQCQACFSAPFHTLDAHSLRIPMQKGQCCPYCGSCGEPGSEASSYLPETQKPGGAWLGPGLPGSKACSSYCSAHPLIASGRFPGHSVTSVTAITSHLLSNIQETNRRSVFLGWLVPRVHARPDPGHNHFRYKHRSLGMGSSVFLPHILIVFDK